MAPRDPVAGARGSGDTGHGSWFALWVDLIFPAHARAELRDRLGVLVQRNPVADKDIRVEPPRREQLPGPLEAVQHGHRPGDRDLLVVDLVRLDRRPRVVA